MTTPILCTLCGRPVRRLPWVEWRRRRTHFYCDMFRDTPYRGRDVRWLRRLFRSRAVLVVALSLAATVSTTPYCAGALHAQARGESPAMPPPGNPGHQEPPKGAYCDRSAAVEHHCECHNQCVENDDGTIGTVEDGPNCRAWCYKKYCRCPWDNCKTPTTPAPKGPTP